MAAQKANKAKRNGRIKQMVQIYRTTKVHDPSLPWALTLAFIAPILASSIPALIFANNWISWVLWPLTGALIGILLVMIVLGRRAEKTAYQQIEGRPGAVGAVVQSALRRSWRGSETPIAINRNQDAIYRVVGRGGVVLISEGSKQRTQKMITDEERKIRRALRNVEIVHLHVGTDENSIRLHRLSKTLIKLKPKLNRAEINAVFNRLLSLQSTPVGIPKGVDPQRVRAPRPR